MGTRHMIYVMADGEYRVAQYGQWDGYPEGAGADLLATLAQHPLSEILEAVRKARFISEQEWNDSIREITGGQTPEFLNQKEHAAWQQKYPLFTRDIGGEILGKIMSAHKNGDPILLHDLGKFSSDSLSIEWGYVLDFDKNTFEVYKGFNKKPLDPGERFYIQVSENTTYHPIRFVKAYDLDALPTVDQFVAEIQALTEGD